MPRYNVKCKLQLAHRLSNVAAFLFLNENVRNFNFNLRKLDFLQTSCFSSLINIHYERNSGGKWQKFVKVFSGVFFLVML